MNTTESKVQSLKSKEGTRSIQRPWTLDFGLSTLLRERAGLTLVEVMLAVAILGIGLTVLIATDVLSEGQNLQDCATIVNFDLPWAIIE